MQSKAQSESVPSLARFSPSPQWTPLQQQIEPDVRYFLVVTETLDSESTSLLLEYLEKFGRKCQSLGASIIVRCENVTIEEIQRAISDSLQPHTQYMIFEVIPNWLTANTDQCKDLL